MHRLASDHAGKLFRSDRDLTADYRSSIHAADAVKAERAVLKDLHDDQRDLIHVRRAEQSALCRLSAFFVYENIAEAVGPDRIRRQIHVCKLTKNIIPHCMLSPGCAGKTAERFKAFLIHHAPHLSAKAASSAAVCSTSVMSMTSTGVCMYRSGTETVPAAHPDGASASASASVPVVPGMTSV